MNQVNNKKQVRTSRKIEHDILPHFYTEYPWSPVRDYPEHFFGRELELRTFWYQMARLIGVGPGTRTNYAFIGQRKLGKTAYLKRCYNIAFWEQDEVVPFYYSFAEKDAENSLNITKMQDLRETLPVILLRQFFAFYTKDETFVELEKMEDLLHYVNKIKFDKKTEILRNMHSCLEQINNCRIENMKDNEDIFMVRCLWQITQSLTIVVRKKCFLIIDEAQEMETSVFNGKEHRPCKTSISEIIPKDHSLVFVSGSNVSMLVNNFLDHSVANRISKSDFNPLREKDAKNLIQKRCPNGYSNIEEDLFKLVGGNPYYIDKILSFNLHYSFLHDEDKDFSSFAGLKKAYDFEVLHPKGEIYSFWNVHIRKNKKDLNNDPKGKKGLALQLLYKVASNQNRSFTYEELMEEFGVDEDTLEKKIEQLENANFIEPTGVGRFAHAFPDKVLPVMINHLYHRIILEGPSKFIAEQAHQDYLKLMSSSNCDINRIKEMVNEVKHNFAVMEQDINDINLSMLELNKKIKSARGKINFKKGMAKENEVRAKIRHNIETNTMFPGYALEGDVVSVNFSESGGTACQIDVYAKLSKKQGKKKHSFIFMAEVKNTKTKISLKDAKKFVATLSHIKTNQKLKDIKAMYISTAGFAKTAQNYLESFKINCVEKF